VINLTQPAPDRGAAVLLTSSNPNVLSVQATVTVSQGMSYGFVNITSYAVSENTSVTIMATLNNTKSGTILVKPVAIQGMSSSPSSLTGGSGNVIATVNLNTEAPSGGAEVSLTSNHASAIVPATVTVPAGQTQVSFTISTSTVTSNTTVTVTASLNGTSKTYDVQLTKN
jgi:hypothetical protein